MKIHEIEHEKLELIHAGATAVEYSLLVNAYVGLLNAFLSQYFGTSLDSIFNDVSGSL